jgi:hypothetical protein
MMEESTMALSKMALDMALGSITSLMVMHMRACGKRTRDMVRASITIRMEKSIEACTS